MYAWLSDRFSLTKQIEEKAEPNLARDNTPIKWELDDNFPSV